MDMVHFDFDFPMPVPADELKRDTTVASERWSAIIRMPADQPITFALLREGTGAAIAQQCLDLRPRFVVRIAGCWPNFTNAITTPWACRRWKRNNTGMLSEWQTALTPAQLRDWKIGAMGFSLCVEHRVPLATGTRLAQDAEISGLQLDMCELFELGKHSDVTVVHENISYRVHKGVLCARSRYFDALFSERFGDGTKATAAGALVEVHYPCDPATFHRALAYIYGGCIRDAPKTTDAWVDLWAAAAFMLIDALPGICADMVKDHMDDDVAALLVTRAGALPGAEEVCISYALDYNLGPQVLTALEGSGEVGNRILVQCLLHETDGAPASKKRKRVDDDTDD